MASKWLELLKEVAPRVARVAFLFNPVTAPFAEYYLDPFKAAAASVAMEAIPTPVRNTSELESAIAAQARTPNGGLVVMTDSFLVTHRKRLHRWLLATVFLPSIRFVISLSWAGCCPTEMTCTIVSSALRPMPIASSRVRRRTSFPSRRR